ncbi:siroheme synthase [Roseomonas hellenica]|uniref:precorrin-2 dehydrogenase n=1 Tax=Plastoroseomonas hellenica TaxID=2687306 RepID=A0ABS5F552_9PROT|nr:NAD(P)-dependent oxidoreductase [Plastoroseomonas hellenica]MBR0667698.1 siroheme synthase [Plastoroseomonas hellenica]
MLPLVFLPTTPVLLVGEGPAFDKRRALLEAAGITRLTVLSTRPDAAALDAARLVFGAGLSRADSEWLAAEARARGTPVNIEDVPDLCDLHVPSIVRRGDLLLSVSTAGGAPTLAVALREWLEAQFGPEWAEHLAEVAALRTRLRAEGAKPSEVIAALRTHLAGAGWPPLT